MDEQTEQPDTEMQELEDIEALLSRETADGKGDDEVPPADFESFATEGVEQTDDTEETK